MEIWNALCEYLLLCLTCGLKIAGTILLILVVSCCVFPLATVLMMVLGYLALIPLWVTMKIADFLAKFLPKATPNESRRMLPETPPPPPQFKQTGGSNAEKQESDP